MSTVSPLVECFVRAPRWFAHEFLSIADQFVISVARTF
jgi:hypothetical protein